MEKFSGLRNILETSDFALGTWSQSSSPEMLEIIGYSGFDFTIIDTEHGYYGLETAENLVRAAEAAKISPIIRVATNEPHLIMKALDIGAEGVLVPQVTNPQEAELAVSSARYNPLGNRGACPCIRAGQHYVTEWNQFAQKVNRDVVVMVIVEGESGLQNIEEIVQTEGLDAVMLGPFDMSVALGVGGDLEHSKVLDFMKNVIDVCERYEVQIFIPNFDLVYEEARASIERWRDQGCKFFTVGTDKLLFAHHMKQLTEHIRQRETERS